MAADRLDDNDPTSEAELDAEARDLIAELKRVMADRGKAGVPHVEFLIGWDGVRLVPPILNTEEAQNISTPTSEGDRSSNTRAERPSGMARVASDEQHRTIAAEMDAAFARNIVSNRRMREVRRREWEMERPKATTAAPSTKAPRATPAQLEKIDRGMDAAFAKNVAAAKARRASRKK